MTFTFKLSKRLACGRLLLAAALLAACETAQPGKSTDSGVVLVQSVAVTPAVANPSVSDTQQFRAVVLDANGDTLSRPVSWSTSDTSVASVDATGLLAARSVGSATIVATSQGKSGSGRVDVSPKKIATVTVVPSVFTLSISHTQQLQAVLRAARGDTLTGRVIAWATSDTALAAVSPAGLVTARAAGQATITATSEGKSGAATVTISPVPVASVTLSPTSANLFVGQTVQLAATTKDSIGNVLAGRAITWTSSSTATATVSATGLVTAKAAGPVTITGTSEGMSATASVTVANVPVATVSVSPASRLVALGGSGQLAATTKDSAGNVLAGRSVTWKSSDTTIATVSASGLVRGVAVGAAVITATSEGKSGTGSVTVLIVPVASVGVSPGSMTVAVGTSGQLIATTKDSAGNVLTGRVVTWKSSDTTKATVSGSGQVLGVATGAAMITATSEGKASAASVTVLAPGTHTGWYAAPNGSSGGSGSSASPWNLQTALNGGNGRVQPGDTIWLRGGTYAGNFSSSLSGTALAPIVVRQYPGERATLDGGSGGSDVLDVNGQWAVYWGFELMESGTARFGTAGTGSGLRGDGVYVTGGSNLKFINLVVHDVGHGTYTENAAHNIEIYGWLIYNGGWEDGTRPDGHGIYIKNDGTGWKVARDNVIFNQFGFGIHGYTESTGQLKNLVFDGNVLFDNGLISSYQDYNLNMQLGGNGVADNDSVTNNMLYYAPSAAWMNARIGYNSLLNGSALVKGNYVVGGSQPFDAGYWQNLTVQGNTIWGASTVLVQHDGNSKATQHWSGNQHLHDPTNAAWKLGSTYTFPNWQTAAGAADQATGTTPGTPQVFVRPNRYEAGRANVVIYNWPGQGAVAVDLSGVLAIGASYEVRNVQDFYGSPVASGTYGGGSIMIPMTGVTPPQPIGGSPTAPLRTGPFFDAFVVVTR